MLNDRELLKSATAHVINGIKIERHNAVRDVFESIENMDEQLTTTKNTAVNTMTKDGLDYSYANFDGKVRVIEKSVINYHQAKCVDMIHSKCEELKKDVLAD